MKKYLVIAMSLTTGEIFQEEVPAKSVRFGLDVIIPSILEMENGPIISQGYYISSSYERDLAFAAFSNYVRALYAIGTLI